MIGKHGFLSGLNLSPLSSQIADGWLKYSGALEREKDAARPAGQTSDPLQWPAAWASLVAFFTSSLAQQGRGS